MMVDYFHNDVLKKCCNRLKILVFWASVLSLEFDMADNWIDDNCQSSNCYAIKGEASVQHLRI